MKRKPKETDRENTIIDCKKQHEEPVCEIPQEDNHTGLEGDALYDGDPLALGLYKAMLSLRQPQDIEENLFENYVEFREKTIEESDEIWRHTAVENQTLVTFVKDFTKEGTEYLFYLAVTLEDKNSHSHALLFSFPTNDDNLVDRYRQGENLQGEEIIQESSH